MTCNDTTARTLSIPAHWAQPRYDFGQPILYDNQVCEIVGMDYIDPASAAAQVHPDLVGWCYSFYSSPQDSDLIGICEAEVIAQ